MPKKLYILRHAKAEGAQFYKEDHERNLTARGVNDALRLGAYMQAQAMVPELTLCSPAERTKETLEQLCITLKNLPIEMHKEIYMASVTRLVEVLARVPDHVSSVLLVGHNPSMHHLARKLAKSGDADALEELSLHYPTCTLSVFSVSAKKWSELMSADSTLEAFITSDDITNATVGHAA